jgi:hypothetical protein
MEAGSVLPPVSIVHVESGSGGMQRGHAVVRLSTRISVLVALNVGQH